MEGTVNRTQDERCVAHGIMLIAGETSGKPVFPVCMQMNDEERLRRSSRRR